MVHNLVSFKFLCSNKLNRKKFFGFIKTIHTLLGMNFSIKGMIASLQCARSCSQSVNFAKLSPEWGAKVWLTDWATHSKEDFMGDTIIITSLVTDFESHRTWEENHDFRSGAAVVQCFCTKISCIAFFRTLNI